MGIRYTRELPEKRAFYDLYEVAGWNGFLGLNEDELLEALKNSWLVVSAYDGERLVGTGRVISDGKINAYVCGLYVLPEYRNQGIGQGMMRFVMDICKEKKLCSLQLVCEEDKVGYYEKLDFAEFTVGMKWKYIRD